jgi:toxin CcdB
MARFDVYAERDGSGLLLDCQADLLSVLETRFVVPLMPLAGVRPPFPRLNPVFTVDGRDLVMVTQGAASIGTRSLGPVVGSLAEEQPAIMNALDMLMIGF